MSDKKRAVTRLDEIERNVKPERHQWRVWVGLTDKGKGLMPDVYECETDGRCVAVFPTKKAAREKYQCVHRAELVWSDSLQETRKKMTVRRAGPRQRTGPERGAVPDTGEGRNV